MHNQQIAVINQKNRCAALKQVVKDNREFHPGVAQELNKTLVTNRAHLAVLKSKTTNI